MHITELWKKLDEIRTYQNSLATHALTCGNDSTHRVLQPYLHWTGEEHQVYLSCPDCDYIQNHIPHIDFAGSVAAGEELHRIFGWRK